MLSTILDTIFNGLLVGASGYALCSLEPAEHPFAFAASAVGLCHGCTGIYALFFDKFASSGHSAGKYLNHAKMFTTTCMETVSLPLINMDLYISSQQTTALALGHSLFIIPLAFDLTFRVFAAEEAEDDCTETLKDLTILGNIVSLLFYAINENNLPAGIMALLAFFAYYGSSSLESLLPGIGNNSSLAGYALFFSSVPVAIGAASGGAMAS